MDDVVRRARLEAWFRADADRILAFLLHRTDRDTAQDVLQEVFVIAYRKAAVVPEPPTGWLFGTARRVLANTVRGQRRRDLLSLRLTDAAQIAAPSASSASSDTDDQIGDDVRDTLAKMSSADREVLTLSAWYELSADEAARALGCSRSAYTVRLHRARRRFADRLHSGDSGASVGSSPVGRSEPLRSSGAPVSSGPTDPEIHNVSPRGAV